MVFDFHPFQGKISWNIWLMVAILSVALSSLVFPSLPAHPIVLPPPIPIAVFGIFLVIFVNLGRGERRNWSVFRFLKIVISINIWLIL